MNIARLLFALPRTKVQADETRLDVVGIYVALAFIAMIVVATLPHRPF